MCWEAHQGLAHEGPGGPTRAWPTRAQGGPQEPRGPTRAQGAHKHLAHKGPGKPTRANGDPPLWAAWALVRPLGPSGPLGPWGPPLGPFWASPCGPPAPIWAPVTGIGPLATNLGPDRAWELYN